MITRAVFAFIHQAPFGIFSDTILSLLSLPEKAVKIIPDCSSFGLSGHTHLACSLALAALVFNEVLRLLTT